MIKTVIFDFFDVFRTDSYKAWLTSNGFERTGLFAEASILMDQGRIDSEEFYRQISEAADRDVTPEEIDASAVLNEGMVEFARHLRKKYKTVLLSNGPGPFVRMLLDIYEINDIFDIVLISGETGMIKPYPESFHNALNKSGSVPEETIFIDDNPANVESAETLGIRSIVFKSVDELQKDLHEIGLEF